MTPKPTGYDEAVKLAGEFLSADGPYTIDRMALARALLYAHEQRRTEGTRELCLKHSVWQNEPESPCTNSAMAGYECQITDCPIRRGGEG